MRQGQAALGHHFNEVSKAELVTAMSAHAEDDNSTVKMASVEQSVNVFQLAH